MRELVFNIENIFNTSTEGGALQQYGSNKFYIPAYQRGYKWGSDANGAVSVLLSDLKEAFEAKENGLRNEYYLQYVTVKKKEPDLLEVIDGQQRLTTLSIILSAFSVLLESENLAKDKLVYAIRSNFFDSHIYSAEDLKLLISQDWEGLIGSDSSLDRQDIYYLFTAAQKVFNFLNKEVEKEKYSLLYSFLLQDVMLIVNSVESHVSSETVFRNLNSNQVPLTEAELVKGYLITKIGRNGNSKSKTHFREILELRANLGRKWDEMSAWCNRVDIKSFYFSKGEGMEGLLTLTAMMLSEGKNALKKGKKEDFHLFNFYHRLEDTEMAYMLLKENFEKLLDWYGRTDIYNLVGYCRFVKGNTNNNLNFLKELLEEKDLKGLFKLLEATKTSLLPDGDVRTLKYGGDEDQLIHAVLLELNVFPKGINYRFDFYRFDQENWTLEHIFPQSPEGKKYILTAEQRELVLNMLGPDVASEVKEVLIKESRTEEEKKLYYDALKGIGMLDSIGNMCLLTGPDNSSNGNLFFKEKRNNVLRLIQKGSFLPKHTFDVFSKMIDSLENSDLGMWTRDDIKGHQNFISSSFQIETKVVPE